MPVAVMPISAPVIPIPHPRASGETLAPTLCNENRIKVLDVDVAALTRAEAKSRIGELLEAKKATRVVFVNASCLNISVRDNDYRRVLTESDLVLNDGAGLDIAARIQGKGFPANLNGTDFTPEILGLAADLGKRVFLVGGGPGVADAAASHLTQSIPGLKIVGASHGFQRSDRETQSLLEEIRALNVDILIVGMGAPTQEIWLEKHLAATGARLGVAVGAYLDFTAGRVPRAPLWMRDMKLEWVFRLGLEPRRLFRRYVIGNPIFVYRVISTHASLRRRSVLTSSSGPTNSKGLGRSDEQGLAA